MPRIHWTTACGLLPFLLALLTIVGQDRAYRAEYFFGNGSGLSVGFQFHRREIRSQLEK